MYRYTITFYDEASNVVHQQFFTGRFDMALEVSKAALRGFADRKRASVVRAEIRRV